MTKIIKVIVIMTLFLTYAFPVVAERVKEDKADINVLRERIKEDNEKITIQLKALKDELALRSETLKKLMNLYLGFTVLLLAVILFLGYKTINKLMKQTMDAKTDEEIKKYITKEYVEELLRKKGQGALNKLLYELEKKLLYELEIKGKETLSKLKNLKTEYENTPANLKTKDVDINKPLPESTVKNSGKFAEQPVQTKTEQKYSFDDWFHKGSAEYEKEEYVKAITSWTKAIESDTKDAVTYSRRGLAYGRLKHYERAIEDYNKAIELSPNSVLAHLGLAETYIIRGDYKNALDIITKTLSISSEIQDKAICFYLECIAKRLLNMDTTEAEARLNEILKNDFALKWSFDEIESWLKDTDIKTFISNKTEVLKRYSGL